MGCTEWLAVLRALMQKTLSAGLSDFAVASSILDEGTENAIEPNLKDILAGTSSIHSLVRVSLSQSLPTHLSLSVILCHYSLYIVFEHNR